ncbi:hypothetical protein [Flagellimonas lutimaris]|nr:hypothetical protein [Allomuricauda lutimaris]
MRTNCNIRHISITIPLSNRNHPIAIKVQQVKNMDRMVAANGFMLNSIMV